MWQTFQGSRWYRWYVVVIACQRYLIHNTRMMIKLLWRIARMCWCRHRWCTYEEWLTRGVLDPRIWCRKCGRRRSSTAYSADTESVPDIMIERGFWHVAVVRVSDGARLAECSVYNKPACRRVENALGQMGKMRQYAQWRKFTNV